MNKNLKKIVDSEKEDLQTIKKVFRGEKVKPRFSFKDLNILELIADNWLLSIVLVAFLMGGFLLGAMSFENVCTEALMQCQDDCNEFYGVSDLDFSFYNFTPEASVFPGEFNEEEKYD